MHRRTLLLGGLAATTLGASRPDPSPPADLAKAGKVGEAGWAGKVGEAGLVKAKFAVDTVIEARTSEVDLSGQVMQAWSYDGRVPGTPVRVRTGDQLRVTLANRLPTETTIHWHGIAVSNKEDGVPHLTQEPIQPGADFTYEFAAMHPGTYWFHPHTGTQLDRGLYTPLVIEDPNEPLAYDEEWVVVLDDWLDGDPDEVLAELQKGMADSGMIRPRTTSALLRGEAGNVQYPYFLVNGRPQGDPEVFTSKPGQKVRIRFLNAGSDTVFRIAIGGHRMTVTHSDGYPVVPVETDALLIGMGERYDVVVRLGAGVFPLVALAEGRADTAFGLIRTAGGAAPASTVMPAELKRHILGYPELRPAEPVALRRRPPDRRIRLDLTGSMADYSWGFNGKHYDHMNPLKDTYEIAAGERVRLEFANTTSMFHPLHVHGHTFAIGEERGPRKDTVIVLPGQAMPVYFDADNPGLWMIHCHNVYHAESGMMTVLAYEQAA